MYSILNIETWNRKEHFHFFKNFEEPFFGMTVDVDCTHAYQHCKNEGHSFFLFYLHKSIKAANLIEPFRYRIIEEKVVVYEQVHASATINKPDGTFGFSFIDYTEDHKYFIVNANKEIERVQNSHHLMPEKSGENIIHYSSLPWFKFTGLSHARSFSKLDTCPKISFGKMIDQGDKKIMPVSIHVHHALMDGFHVAQYIELFQKLLDGEHLENC